MWLGIDFGTCNSSAALLLDGTLKRIAEPLKHDYCFPSSVFVIEQGEILVGHAAENARQKDPQRYRREFKRDLGSEAPYILGNCQLLPEELVSAVIHKLKVEADKVVKGRGMEPLSDAIITVPATYQAYKRDMMQKAGITAGFSQVELLEEPVAAAIYYSRHASVREGEIILVYDLGGGTFDATLIQKQAEGYSILAMPKGLPHCGGRDFDREIYMHLKHQCSEPLRQRLEDRNDWRTKAIVGDFCQQIKHQLSEAEEAEVYIPIGDGESYVLDRQVFNDMIEPLINETIDCCDQMVRSAGIEWHQVNQVLLVGGSCRIPYVQERVKEKFGRPPLLVDEPELAVCLGASIFDEEFVPSSSPYKSDKELETDKFLQQAAEIELNRQQGQAAYFSESLPNGASLEMVYIPSGKFTMGATTSEKGSFDNERPQHQVTIPSFFMSKYQVTQAQWKAVTTLPKVKTDLNPDPSNFKGDRRPVEQVSWEDAIEFCARLSGKAGREYRLPSESEWEYACRAGTTTPFHFGETFTIALANCQFDNCQGTDWEYQGKTDSDTYGYSSYGNYPQETTEVGSFPPNAFGLYDMHGNVWEWCLDQGHESYRGAPTDGSAWVTGGSDSHRLLRGGSWNFDPRYCRSACRIKHEAVRRICYFGFRVVCSSAASTLGEEVILTPSSPPTRSQSVETSETGKLSGESAEIASTSIPPLINFIFTVAKVTSVETTRGFLGLGELKVVRFNTKHFQSEARFFKEDLGNGVSLEMVAIPEGTFVMGSPAYEVGHRYSEAPPHKVVVPSFFMGNFQITQAQWQAVADFPKVDRDLKRDPSHFKGHNRPVENISWWDAVEFCARLSQWTGRKYRLPSESEWEYACRAGTSTLFHFGDTISTEIANYAGSNRLLAQVVKRQDVVNATQDIPVYAVGSTERSLKQTKQVGSFSANAFGLYDMHGNVWEWCADDWHENYDCAPTDGSTWCDRNDANKVLRGGSWRDHLIFCRSACRINNPRDNHYDNIGFRVVCSIPRT